MCVWGERGFPAIYLPDLRPKLTVRVDWSVGYAIEETLLIIISAHLSAEIHPINLSRSVSAIPKFYETVGYKDYGNNIVTKCGRKHRAARAPVIIISIFFLNKIK